MGKKKPIHVKKTKPNQIKSIKKKEKIKKSKVKKRKIDDEIDKYIEKYGKKKIENILKQKINYQNKNLVKIYSFEEIKEECEKKKKFKEEPMFDIDNNINFKFLTQKNIEKKIDQNMINKYYLTLDKNNYKEIKKWNLKLKLNKKITKNTFIAFIKGISNLNEDKNDYEKQFNKFYKRYKYIDSIKFSFNVPLKFGNEDLLFGYLLKCYYDLFNMNNWVFTSEIKKNELKKKMLKNLLSCFSNKYFKKLTNHEINLYKKFMFILSNLFDCDLLNNDFPILFINTILNRILPINDEKNSQIEELTKEELKIYELNKHKLSKQNYSINIELLTIKKLGYSFYYNLDYFMEENYITKPDRLFIEFKNLINEIFKSKLFKDIFYLDEPLQKYEYFFDNDKIMNDFLDSIIYIPETEIDFHNGITEKETGEIYIRIPIIKNKATSFTILLYMTKILITIEHEGIKHYARIIYSFLQKLPEEKKSPKLNELKKSIILYIGRKNKIFENFTIEELKNTIDNDYDSGTYSEYLIYGENPIILNSMRAFQLYIIQNYNDNINNFRRKFQFWKKGKLKLNLLDSLINQSNFLKTFIKYYSFDGYNDNILDEKLSFSGTRNNNEFISEEFEVKCGTKLFERLFNNNRKEI